MDQWFDIDELMDHIYELLDVGLYDDALVLLDNHRGIFPNEVEICVAYSQIHTDRGEPTKAFPYLQEGLQLDRDNLDCLLGTFYAYSQTRQLDKGAPFLMRAEQVQPQNEAVLSSLIWYHAEINRYDIAVQYFEKARQRVVENPETFRNAGIAFQRLRRYAEAESCFRAALGINPAFEDARDLLSDTYLMMGEPEKAVQVYRDHLEKFPNHVRSLSRLVFCLCQNELYEEAVVEARKAIVRYPNSAVGYVDLAYVYLNMDEVDKALDIANKALDIAPLDAEAYRLRGILLSEKEDDDGAEREFGRALELDPNNVEIKRDYYHHLRNVGNFDQMEKTVNSVIEDEYPYCTEDYWFLADYCRDTGDNHKAFEYLHRAHSLMPGEGDLLPPMVDVLLDEGHISYASRLLGRYVRENGWTDVMDEFARHRRMRGSRNQEGLRLLRFMGEESPYFRQYLFVHYVQHFLRPALIGLAVIFTGMVALFFGLRGLVFAVATIAGMAVGWLLVNLVNGHRRRAMMDSRE